MTTFDRLPETIEETFNLLKAAISRSSATLDEKGGGTPEGLVLRIADRSRIVKLRFEDHEKTIRKRKLP